MNLLLNPFLHRLQIGLALLAFGTGTMTAAAASGDVPRWSTFEHAFTSSTTYTNPLQQAEVTVTFTSPSGVKQVVPGFWDGGTTFRVRFNPGETGAWNWTSQCSDKASRELNGVKGTFNCTAAKGSSPWAKHGPIQVSKDRRSFVHADGTPFFYLGDTAWNGPLMAAPEDWLTYLQARTNQQFSAVQWVATQWRAAPKGDRNNQVAYTGREQISVNPAFFQRLDKMAEATAQAGLLNVPVLLWALAGQDGVAPGSSLPEDQAILLARYMVARWQGLPVLWLLGGDGHYFGSEGEKWKRIGRAVFGDISHAPVGMHPQGRHWNWHDFKDEKWLGFIGYQSGHSDEDATLKWINEGPVSKDWQKEPFLPFINLEPPYENHLGYRSKKPLSPEAVRNAAYWSLFNAPTAGVSYGGHGVWGWDDGTKPPTDHPGSGTPLPWKQALQMPGALQMQYLAVFFRSFEFWRLRPYPAAVVNQPGAAVASRYISAARTEQKDITVVYVPQDRTVEVLLDALPPSPEVKWFNPRTGEYSPAVAVVTEKTCQFPTPSEGDWILWMQTQTKIPAPSTTK